MKPWAAVLIRHRLPNSGSKRPARGPEYERVELRGRRPGVSNIHLAAWIQDDKVSNRGSRHAPINLFTYLLMYIRIYLLTKRANYMQFKQRIWMFHSNGGEYLCSHNLYIIYSYTPAINNLRDVVCVIEPVSFSGPTFSKCDASRPSAKTNLTLTRPYKLHYDPFTFIPPVHQIRLILVRICTQW